MFRPYCGDWLYVLDGDDEALYRAIHPKFVHALEVAKSDFFPAYETTDHTMDIGPHQNCPVVRTERLPFQIRIQELTRAQALECVLFLIDLAIFCHEEHGVTPMDIHEGNFLWWDRPYFVDYDALWPLTHATASTAFARIGYCLYKYVSRQPLTRHDEFNFTKLRKLEGWMGRQVHRPDFTDKELWRELRNIMQTLKVPTPPKTHWADEYAIAKLNDLAANPKFAALMELAPPGRTMLDVGCNRGYVGHLLRDRYDYILGFDDDEGCIDHAQRAAGLNFANFGIRYLAQDIPAHPLSDRFEADVVLALAVTHHFKKAGLTAPFVAGTLARFTKRYLLIEDIEAVDEYHRCLKSHGLKIAKQTPSHPHGRALTLWERS